jgi:hypothetical protein
MYAPHEGYNPRVPKLQHYYGLNHLHYLTNNNPAKGGLVNEPGDWPWSSWRFYFMNDASFLAMDTVP